MDVLSKILANLQPRGRIFCRGVVRSPWAITGGSRAPLFHLAVQGQGLASIADEEPKPFGAGDLIVLIRGGRHRLASDPNTPAVELGQAVCPVADREVGDLVLDGGGAATTLICGMFELTGAADHPLVAGLPDILIVPCGIARWLEMTVGLLHDELRDARLGSELVATRLCEIMLVQALRAHVEHEDPSRSDFVKALADDRIGAALALVHSQPEQGWRAAALAARVGMSRSAFFARFVELVGAPPARYITRVAMQRAAGWLVDPTLKLSVTELAERLGYGSESAFTRAFTRYHGESPRAFTRARQPSPR